MIRVIDGEALPEPDRGWGGAARLGDLLPFLFGSSSSPRWCCARSRSARSAPSQRAASPAFVGWVISQLVPVAVGAGVFAFLMSLLLGGHRRWSLVQPAGHGGGAAAGGRWIRRRRLRRRRLRRWRLRRRRRQLRGRRRLGALVSGA
jgi:hypothetical protein